MYICPIVGALSRCLVAKLLLPSLEEVEKNSTGVLQTPINYRAASEIVLQHPTFVQKSFRSLQKFRDLEMALVRQENVFLPIRRHNELARQNLWLRNSVKWLD